MGSAAGRRIGCAVLRRRGAENARDAHRSSVRMTKQTIAREALPLHGGAPTTPAAFRRYNSIGDEEVKAATAVVQSGVLSRYLGSWGPDFYGGPKVQEFERAWATAFDVPHAVAVNSL